MKKLIILITFLGFYSVSYAKSFEDWSNEDLCRWIDAVQVPDPILLEIEVRDLVCLSNPEIIEVSIQEPYASEHGTVFPSPSSNNTSNKNLGSGIKFIFNYKVKL
jgi:hypothetical protein